MATKQETIILNDYGSGSGLSGAIRRRTSAKGKTTDRVSVNIKSEPLVHTFDDAALGAGPAAAIRDAFEAAIKGITAIASPSTIARRNHARQALANGTAPKSIVKRYSGGRTGTKPPKTSVRLFNDSDRLSEGLFVRQNPREASWTTNVPANRFTGDTQHLLGELFDLIGDKISPRALLDHPDVSKEIRASLEQILQKANNEGDIKRAQLRSAKIRAAKMLLGFRG
jgi:hypothetical protein